MNMKKVSVVLTLLVGLTLVLGFAVQGRRGIDNSPLMDDERPITPDNVFQVRVDGTVRVNGLDFASMSDYYRSEYFKVNHMRCKVLNRPEHMERLSVVKAKPGGGGGGSDCDNSKTVIKSQYNINRNVNIVFHVLYSGSNGYIPVDQIERQVAVMNDDYQGTGISFTLAGVTYHENNQWFNDRRESQYKSATGWDRNAYFNVWTNTASGYLGYSYLPAGSAGSVYDGVVLNYQACGGRNEGSAPYDQGRTLVHEAGHYFGLLHTFDGGCCDGYTCGDLINDTNAESTPFYYCGPRTTCGSPDPTTNYMDYSEDLCMYEFTSEQENRMGCSILTYRAGL
jgi:hypothetical protein